MSATFSGEGEDEEAAEYYGAKRGFAEGRKHRRGDTLQDGTLQAEDGGDAEATRAFDDALPAYAAAPACPRTR